MPCVQVDKESRRCAFAIECSHAAGTEATSPKPSAETLAIAAAELEDTTTTSKINMEVRKLSMHLRIDSSLCAFTR